MSKIEKGQAHATLRGTVRAAVRVLARLTDPDANQSAERALIASRERVAESKTRGSAEDWQTTGDDLRAAIHKHRPAGYVGALGRFVRADVEKHGPACAK